MAPGYVAGQVAMSAILDLVQLGFPWEGLDPFLFTVHHLDHYPEGSDDDLGPVAPLMGRNLGSDFSYLSGWSMYHGVRVPGSPSTHTAGLDRDGGASGLRRPFGLPRRNGHGMARETSSG